jgi:Fe2+ transport system protein FeoA
MGLTFGAVFRVLAKGRPGPFIIQLKDSRLILGHGMVHRLRVASVREATPSACPSRV